MRRRESMPPSRQTGKVSMALQESSNTPESYLIPKAAFALDAPPACDPRSRQGMKTHDLSIPTNLCPGSRPCLNKVPFQLVQLLANHRTTPVQKPYPRERDLV